MKSKALFFIGIGLLMTGIVFRKVFFYEVSGLLLLLSGILMKTIYIVMKARSGEYQPGSELVYLFAGLSLFLSGLYLKSISFNSVNPELWIGAGIALKIVFILLFVKKVKKNREGLIE